MRFHVLSAAMLVQAVLHKEFVGARADKLLAMQFYDIFNGDADGICALHQLRLEEPRASVLVTGVKRDVRLLDRVHAAAGRRAHRARHLAQGQRRRPGAPARGRRAAALLRPPRARARLPRHANLKAFIDTAPDTCTSLIVDRYLDGRQRLWAVVAAFGDNLPGPARRAAAGLDLDEDELQRLRELGRVHQLQRLRRDAWTTCTTIRRISSRR